MQHLLDLLRNHVRTYCSLLQSMSCPFIGWTMSRRPVSIARWRRLTQEEGASAGRRIPPRRLQCLSTRRQRARKPAALSLHLGEQLLDRGLERRVGLSADHPGRLHLAVRAGHTDEERRRARDLKLCGLGEILLDRGGVLSARHAL